MTTSLINPSYKFPNYFSWPFFFTIQKHGETRRKQLLMWTELILQFCKDNKLWRLSKSVFFDNLGQNPKINRKIALDSIETIFSSMVEGKRAVYVNEKVKDELFVLWKTFSEWEDFIYQSAVNRQSIDKLETLQYITQDDDNKGEEYYNMDKDMLVTILLELEKKGKCQLLADDNDVYMAVKFFK